MGSFVGRYFFLVDESFRVAVPSSFRKVINEEPTDNTLFLFPGPKFTIRCFPRSSWEEFRHRLEKTYNPKNKPVSEVLEYISENTWDVKMDAQGRILINEHLRKHAKITVGSEVVIRGFEKYFGITSRENYEKERRYRLEEIWKDIVAEEGSLKEEGDASDGGTERVPPGE